MDKERQKMEWEMKERQAEEQRLREGDIFRRQNEDLTMRMHHQDEEMRRRQDKSSFMQVLQIVLNLLFVITAKHFFKLLIKLYCLYC